MKTKWLVIVLILSFGLIQSCKPTLLTGPYCFENKPNSIWILEVDTANNRFKLEMDIYGPKRIYFGDVKYLSSNQFILDFERYRIENLSLPNELEENYIHLVVYDFVRYKLGDTFPILPFSVHDHNKLLGEVNSKGEFYYPISEGLDTIFINKQNGEGWVLHYEVPITISNQKSNAYKVLVNPVYQFSENSFVFRLRKNSLRERNGFVWRLCY